MTLSNWLLETIDTEWPDGDIPDDVTRVNANDSELLDGPIRSRAKHLKKANYIGVRHTQRDDIPGGVNTGSEREAVLRVQVEGLVKRKGGSISDHQEFRDLVRGTKEAIRAVKHSPGVGDEHPATWVKVMVGPETGGSSAQSDYYQTIFDVTLEGHE